MQWLAEISIKRPVFASVLILALVIVGGVSYFTLGIDRFPKVDFPMVTITVRQDGAASEEIETEITDEIERAVNTISGIDELRSVSSEGVSQVFVQFVLEKNIDVASQEVRDKVDQIIGDLPASIETPVIDKVDPDAAAVLQVAVSADRPIREISEFADKTLRRELESLSGVGDVRLIGSRLRQVNLWLEPARLRSFDLTVAEVTRAVENQNVQLPGGSLEQGGRELSVRLSGRVASVDALGDVAVAMRGGTQVKLRDVARVEDGSETAETAANVRGKPTVVLAIRRQSGTNTVAVVDALKQRLTDLESRLPAGFSLEILRDQSEYIEASVHTVQEHLVVGALLAAIVVLFFLRSWRSTLIAAIAIPTSIVSTFALISALGLTLNMMTLLALTLAVGIVIDDAIVVIENITRLMEEKGLSAVEAAREGTREIGLAVLATTLSLIAVFLPVAFMDGIVGRFMYSFGMAMAFSILVSLLVAFTLTPMLASRWLAKEPLHRAPPRWAVVLDDRYEKLLRWCMSHRSVVVGACAISLASVIPLMVFVGKDFLPKNDESQFEVSVRTPEGSSLQETELIGSRIAREIDAQSGVKYAVVLVGDDDRRTANLATLFVKLHPVDERARSQAEIMQAVREDVLPHFADLNLRTSVSQIAAIGGGGNSNKDVAFFVGGPDLGKLGTYSAALSRALAKLPGAVDVDTSLVLGKPELRVELDRAKAAELGIQVADVANTLRVLVGGSEISTYQERGEQYEVHARSAASARTSAEDLAQIAVPSSTLGAVSLDHVAHFEESSGPSQIDRLGRRRQVTITANMGTGQSQQAALETLQREVRALHMDPEYRAGVTGSSKEMGNAARGFVLAFALSFVFMYLILAAQFESWIHPLTILLALPLTVPFALLSLYMFGQSLNIYTALGLLVLFGVVKKNAILQVDHTIALRAQGLSLLDATLKANRDRLRPILMTTLAFVAGMVPLLVSSGVGSGDNRAIGSVIFGGQILSLLLTLVATPVAYSLFEDARAWFKPVAWAQRALARLRGRKVATATTTALFACIALVSSCAVDSEARVSAMAAPKQWHGTDPTQESIADLAWWQLFDDAQLRELIEIALVENRDLRQAAARVREARALASQSNASRLPRLDADASLNSVRKSERGVPALPPGADPDGTVGRVGASSSWELDLWGRLAHASDASAADALASEFDRRALVLVLISDLSQAWFDLSELDRELVITKRTLDARRQSATIIRQRADEEIASGLDVTRSEGEIASTAAIVPDLERRIAQLEHRITVLVGRDIDAQLAARDALDPAVPPAVPAGLPAMLLARRPDLLAARERLVATNERIGVAKAALLPSISLTGDFGFESSELSQLFMQPARAWHLGPQLSLPIFDGGRLDAEVDAARARSDQALAAYEKSVQTALREVEDALIDISKLRSVRTEHEALVSALARALELASLRHFEGVASYLDVLDAQRSLFDAERTLSQTRRSELTSIVELYKALGGGWDAQS